MSTESIRETWRNYRRAIHLYESYSASKMSSMDREVQKNSGFTIEEKEKIGAQKWSSSSFAKDMIDEQKLAERKVVIHGIVSIMDLLNEVVASLEATRNELRTIRQMGEIETTKSAENSWRP